MSTSFIESPSFPAEISYGAISGILTSTEVITSLGGVDTRNRNWSRSKRTFDLAPTARSTEEVHLINAFFEACHGRFIGFRLKDWSEFEAVDETTTPISDTVMQLQKVYTVGTLQQVRPIVKPVEGSVVIKVGGVVAPSGWTLDATTGLLTFGSVPAGPVTWSGEFDVPVRFDQDQIQWSVFAREANKGHLFNCSGLTATEIR